MVEIARIPCILQITPILSTIVKALTSSDFVSFYEAWPEVRGMMRLMREIELDVDHSRYKHADALTRIGDDCKNFKFTSVRIGVRQVPI